MCNHGAAGGISERRRYYIVVLVVHVNAICKSVKHCLVTYFLCKGDVVLHLSTLSGHMAT